MSILDEHVLQSDRFRVRMWRRLRQTWQADALGSVPSRLLRSRSAGERKCFINGVLEVLVEMPGVTRPTLCGEPVVTLATALELDFRNNSTPRMKPMSTRLYVGNLSFDSTEDSITQAFERDSRRVQSVSVVMDRNTGRPRGFAFVEMASEADARAAIDALDGTELDGRTLRVNEAQERQSRSDARSSRDQGSW